MKASQKTVFRCRHLGRDEQGQMLVEMAITLPLVLFMFFAALQYLFLVNVSLAGHYAAFAASRSYAVHNSADHDDAIFCSKMAASLAYTPLSSPAPGESLYYATQTVFDPLAEIESEINSGLGAIGVNMDLPAWLMKLLPEASGVDDVVNGLPRPVRALIFAYLRMDLHKPEDSDGMEIMAPEAKYNLPQISMRLNYRLPLWVPGFAETWDLTGGDDADSAFQIVGEKPAMMVRSVCTMGMELWSGEVNDASANRDDAKNSESDRADRRWSRRVNEHEGTDEAFAKEYAEERKEEEANYQAAKEAARREWAQLRAACRSGDPAACAQERAALYRYLSIRHRSKHMEYRQAHDAQRAAQSPAEIRRQREESWRQREERRRQSEERARQRAEGDDWRSAFHRQEKAREEAREERRRQREEAKKMEKLKRQRDEILGGQG